MLLKKTKTHIFEIFLIFLKLKIETKNKHACKLTFLSTVISKEFESKFLPVVATFLLFLRPCQQR